jgi:hypothetical protein
VAHLPTWSGPLYEHWLVEYWHPGAGWVWLEPSLNQFRPAPSTLVVINVAAAADEDDAASCAPPAVRGVMPGAPHLSVQELSAGLLPAYDARRADEVVNLATPEAALNGTPEEFRGLFLAAEKAFARMPREGGPGAAGRADELIAAARAGGVKQLLRTLDLQKGTN